MNEEKTSIRIPPHAIFPSALEAGIRAHKIFGHHYKFELIAAPMTYRLPMNWRIHSGIGESLNKSSVEDRDSLGKCRFIQSVRAELVEAFANMLII